MKLLVLGLDGLDPELVDKWNLHFFKQCAWGRHYVGFFRTRFTPIIWGSMITGLNVEERGYDIEHINSYRSRAMFRNSILRHLYEFRKRFLPKRELGLRFFLKRLGLVRYAASPSMPKELRDRSVFVELEKRGLRTVAIEVPGFNERRNEYFRFKISLLHERKSSREEFEKLIAEALLETARRVREGARYVREGYHLVFVYSPLPDIAFHAFPYPRLCDRLYLRKIHIELWRVVEPLVRFARERGYATMILSDHGFDMENYDHSSHGFWSLSVKPSTCITTALDLKNLMLEIIDRRSPS